MPFDISCRSILSGHFDHSDVEEAIEFNGIILMRFLSSTILFVLLLKNKYRASREDGRRAQLLVLPFYYPIVVATVLYYLVFALLHLFIDNFDNYIALVALDVSFNHMLTEGLAFFFMQHGAGVYALQRSLVFAGGIGIFSFFTFYFIFKNTWEEDEISRDTYFAHAIFSAVIMIFYFVVLITPQKYLYRRPALKIYATYCFVENIVWIIASTLVYAENSAGYCTVLSGKIFFFSILHPFFFIWALARDSEFWQGCYNPTGTVSPVHETWDLNLAVASTMGTALSNMERQVKGLAVVHFSSIEFDFKSFIAGGLSRVYFGKCLQKDVAIKVLFAIELTPKVVTDFYNEVQVMYDLQHDNIVKCLGISVMPPTICVILEYCHYGSLYDYIYNGSETSAADSTSTDTHLSLKSLKKANTEEAVSMTTTAPPRHTIHSIELVDGIGNSDGNVTSGGILNPLRAESNYRKSSSAIDNEAESNRGSIFGSKALSMKGKFFDKISDNFYKMAPNRLSIASASAMSDFHRESRKEKYRSPRFLTTIEKYQLMLGACRGIAFLHDRGYMHCDIKSPNFLISKDKVVKLADLGEARRVDLDYQAPPFPAYNWAPPELLNPDSAKRFYSTASEMYGLAMVFSEILTHSLPLDDLFATSNESEIYHALAVDKLRPALPAEIPDTLRAIITRAWDVDASVRPSANEIMHVLETLYAEKCADL